MMGDRTWEGGMGWNSTGRRKEGWLGLRLMKEHNKEGWKMVNQRAGLKGMEHEGRWKSKRRRVGFDG